MWVTTNTFGKLGRLGSATLKDIQYGQRDSQRLSLSQVGQLLFHADVIRRARGREIDLLCLASEPYVGYTDAEYTPGRQPRTGGILFAPGPDPAPVGFTSVLPLDLTQNWKPRKHQIFLAELSAVPLFLAKHAKMLIGQDLLLFLDNEGSVGSLVRTTSSEPDAEFVAQLCHCLLTMLHVRAWIDWVDSDSNPADGLSRVGLEDERVRSGTWNCVELDHWPVWRWPGSPWEAAKNLLEFAWQ